MSRPGTIPIIWSDGSGETRIEISQLAEARKHDPNLKIKPPYRMQAVSPAGNTVVNQYQGQPGEPNGPSPRWQQNGAYLSPEDPTQSTPMLQSLGNNARYAAAGLPQQAAMLAPLMIPGEGPAMAAARIAAGFVGGTAADAVDRGIQGRAQNPMASVKAGGVNAAVQTASEVLPPVMKAAGKRVAPGLAKAGLGNAPLGAPKELLSFKLPLTEEGMVANQEAINALREAKTAAAANSVHSYDPRQLENEMQALVNRASKYDLLNHSEEGLGKALQTLQEKIGQHYTPTGNATTIRGNPRPTWHGNPGGGIARPFKGNPTMTASELDDINRFAEKAAADLYEGRTTVNGVPIPAGKIPQPSQAELAYKRIADVTNNMMHNNPEIARADAEMARRIALKEPMRKAIQRGAPNFVPAILGQTAGAVGFAGSHSPWGLLAGLPVATLARYGGTPEALQAMALMAQNPAVPDAMRYVPRMVASFVQPYASRADTTGRK